MQYVFYIYIYANFLILPFSFVYKFKVFFQISYDVS
jgi:hypothetical protein